MITRHLILVPISGKHVTKKNSQEIRKRGATRFISQNDVCKAAQLDYHRQARALRAAAAWPAFPLLAPLVLDLVFVFGSSAHPSLHGQPKITRPDVGNLAALVSDALEGVFYADDAVVVEERVTKIWGPRTEVRITITEWTAP